MSSPDQSLSHHLPGGKRYRTPGAPPMAGFREILKWYFGRGPKRGPWPCKVDITPQIPPSLSSFDSGKARVAATWINHSTFLLQTPTANILCDPVYSRCCGPFGVLGPPRVHVPGVPFDALPHIDIVLLSHDHYDHCDLQTLRRLARRDPKNPPLAITPLGNGALFRRAGYARVVELDWWQGHHVSDELQISVTPAQHWSKRLSSSRSSRLWGGFYISVGAGEHQRRLLFAGDSGYHPTIFHEIAKHFGPPDLAMLPIGAYEPRWFMRPQHCNPAEAVQIHRDLESHLSVAMHWGTFRLTDEGRDEPPRALAEAMSAAGLPADQFRILEPGQTLAV